ncbi:hypothetical protein O0L34_g18962 [Tuta absoluta]|nr:hypothetical protein O0L34_g17889 [Tuta absoluta]KAJ2938984.1 hypothetical protein O0L34_g18962 [Tuta absoluta]
MKFEILILLLGCVLANCGHMKIGEIEGRTLMHETVAQYPGVENRRRLKYVVYTDLQMRTIRGIDAHDNMESGAMANILAGGIGYPFVTMKLRSERSKGLDYAIKIFA